MPAKRKNTQSTSGKKPMRDLKTSKDVKGGVRRANITRSENRGIHGNFRAR